MDLRMEWFVDRLSKVLGVQKNPEALDMLLKENITDIQAFFDRDINEVNDMEKCILFVYRTFYDRLVEKEVVSIEKGELTKKQHYHSN